jgi:hypothetical protein
MTKRTENATVNSLPPEPTPYVFRGRTTGLYDRQGQPCRVIALSGNTAYIEFSDGFRSYVPRYVIRRKRGAP